MSWEHAMVTLSDRQCTWSGFYRKTLEERQSQLKLAFPNLFASASSTSSSPYVTPATSPVSPNFPPQTRLVNNNSGDTPFFNSKSPEKTFSVLQNELFKSHLSNGLVTLSNEHKEPFPIGGLDEHIADNMIENCIGTIGLPVGLALNFVINGKSIIIPMAIEEPSVVAAVSGAAKTISSYYGFTAIAPEKNIIIAQIALLDIPPDSMDRAVEEILRSKKYIIDIANRFCTNMVHRGGGVIDITVHRIPRQPNRNSRHRPIFGSSGKSNEWLIVHVHIDVCDAMGANCANTVAEGVAPFLASLTGGRIGVKIVSNLSTERLAKASFRIPLPMLEYKKTPGKEVAERILEAYEWAEIDPYRATTHNKGIMNGVDAVAIATGQDWRAIEAAAHAWACAKGSDSPQFNSSSYRSLTCYWIEEDEMLKTAGKTGDDCLVLCGELELPINVGTTGGVLKTNPVYAYTLGLMNYPDAKKLAMTMVSVGLAQNFAALRAMVTEGIQRGHMSLHAKNMAIAAGCPAHAVSEVVEKMIGDQLSFGTVKEYVENLKFAQSTPITNPSKSRRRSKYCACDNNFQTPLDCVHM